MTKIDPDSVPPTIEAAVDAVIAGLEDDEISMIKGMAEPHMIHHTVGRCLRNSWSLWEDTPLKRDAVNTFKIAHGDDISSLILNWVWARVREEAFDPQDFVKTYHEHWKNAGTNALEAGGWKEDSDAAPKV